MESGAPGGTTAVAETCRLRLFISYSRADLAFADELAGGLEIDGAFDIAIDRHSIIEGEEWKKRLGALIADSDTVVFLLSPSSAKSEVCQWEVDEAVRLTKRIVPVLVTPLGTQPAPSALAALNYVRFDPLEDGKPRSFTAGIKGLIRALKSDLSWLREHTRLLARASEWAEAGRPANRLLTGEAVPEAKAWAARRPKDAPALNALHLDFIAASESAETARASEAAQALAERERLVAQAEQAARERETALDQQRAALRASARMQRVASGLMVVVIAGLLARMYERELNGLWFQFATVRPHLVTAQAAIAKTQREPFWDCTKTDTDYSRHCPGMVVVPAGEFMMGSPDNEEGRNNNEGPLHKVTIAAPFAVAIHAVTFDQWDACAKAGGCKTVASDSGWPRGRRPVINVNWSDAQSYVSWLSAMTGHPYRLLTEAEWEYSARGVTSKDAPHPAFPWGDDDICKHANLADKSFKKAGYTGEAVDCDDTFVTTAPVGSFPANPFGLHDMHGNVDQWVQDGWHAYYEGDPPADGTEWIKDAYTSRRVVRGGSWNFAPQVLRSAKRGRDTTDYRNVDLGFRVGRTLLPPGK